MSLQSQSVAKERALQDGSRVTECLERVFAMIFAHSARFLLVCLFFFEKN